MIEPLLDCINSKPIYSRVAQQSEVYSPSNIPTLQIKEVVAFGPLHSASISLSMTKKAIDNE